jgi:hypothetical protein
VLDSHVGKKDIDLRSREDNLAETEKEKKKRKEKQQKNVGTWEYGLSYYFA